LSRKPDNNVYEKEARKGLFFMVMASVFFSFMGAMVNYAQILEPEGSPLVSSFVRLVVNILVIAGVAWHSGGLWKLPGDRRPSLWARGFFGALSLIFVMYGIHAIGVGETSFLHASNSIIIAALSPFVLRQANSRLAWVAIAGATIGLWFLAQPRFEDHNPAGRIVALLSGVWAAIAYLMIARAGRSNSSNTVIFYLCGVGMMLHMLIFMGIGAGLPVPGSATGIVWPRRSVTYGFLVGAGVMASVAQFFLTAAYQSAPAALNAAISYLTPVLNLGWSVFFFGRHPDGLALAGAAMVLVCGVALPVIGVSARKKTNQAHAAKAQDSESLSL
jgi:S-adenosylmethionine uptake transporter